MRALPQSSRYTLHSRAFSSGSNFTIEVPQMGDSISEGTVVEWSKMPGEYVEVDDVIAVLGRWIVHQPHLLFIEIRFIF